jgi:hypothetical protein
MERAMKVPQPAVFNASTKSSSLKIFANTAPFIRIQTGSGQYISTLSGEMTGNETMDSVSTALD